jgi:hypothetical protein
MRIDELLPNDVIDGATAVFLATGFDILRSPDFWESWVSIQLGGTRTPHKTSFDVEVNIWGKNCKAEVKFSNAFWAKFTPIRGDDWSRHCFRWSVTKPQLKKQEADAFILIGLDVDRTIACWVIPAGEMKANHITVCVPSERVGKNGKIDQWKICPGQMLPAFAHHCHDTRRLKSPQLDIEDYAP